MRRRRSPFFNTLRLEPDWAKAGFSSYRKSIPVSRLYPAPPAAEW